MKRPVILLALASLALTGCGPTLTPEEQFLRAVRAEFVDQADATDRQFISLGTGICDALESGASEADLLEIGQSQGMTKRENRVAIDAAKQYLCE